MPFKPGQSGNPGGKKKGTVNKWKGLRNALAEVCKGGAGETSLKKLMQTQPAVFWRLIADLEPKTHNVKSESHNTYEVAGLQESLALAEEAAAASNAIPLRKSGTD